MKMISNFFDFIFYRTYTFYKTAGDNMPGIYALCIITLFPLLNLSSLIFILIDLFKIKGWNYSKLLLLSFFFCVLLINYYRIYRHIGVKKILEKWDEADKKSKKRLGTGMMVYLIASMVFLFASIIY